MKIKAGSREVEPTHHASLSDGKKTLGLIFVDAEGQQNIRSLKAQPYPRTALKTTQGNSKYSDYEEPYFALAQDDFTGGRGNEEFEKDTSRYFDGHAIDTLKDTGAIIGGLEQCSTALRGGHVELPGDVAWRTLVQGKDIAYMFTAKGSWTSVGTSVLLRKVGSPTGTVSIGIYSNVASLPGVELTSYPGIDIADLSDERAELRFDGEDSVALTNLQNYWVVVSVTYTSTDGNNYVEIGGDNTVTGKYNDGGWGNVSFGIYFRVFETYVDSNGWKFVSYKGALLAITYNDDTNWNELWLNGDWGACDNSGSKTSVTDASKSWTTDEWVGAILVITRGMEVGRNFAKITSNTGTVLTLEKPLGEICKAGEHDYVIINTTSWQVLDNNFGTTGEPCTDIAVAGKNIYAAMGEESTGNARLVYRREYYTNASDNWVARSATENVSATKILTIRHPDLGDVVYGAQNQHPDHGVCIWRGLVPPHWGDLYYKYGDFVACDNPWDTFQLTNVTQTVGPYANTRINISSSFTTGTAAVQNIDPLDITKIKQVALAIKSSVSTNLGDVEFGYDEVEDFGQNYMPTKVFREKGAVSRAITCKYYKYSYDIKPLAVFHQKLVTTTNTFDDLTGVVCEGKDNVAADANNITIGAQDALVIGFSEIPDSIYVWVENAQQTNSVVTTGQKLFNGRFINLSGWSDGTVNGGRAFYQDGAMTWSKEALGHWEKNVINSVEAYWIYIGTDIASTAFDLNEIKGTINRHQISDVPGINDGNITASPGINLYVSNEYFSVGASAPYNKIVFNLNSPFNNNINTGPMKVYYYNGYNYTNQASGVSDGTMSGSSVTFSQDGTISFTPPEDWEPSIIDGVEAYWTLLSPQDSIDTVEIQSVYVVADNNRYIDPEYDDLKRFYDGKTDTQETFIWDNNDRVYVGCDEKFNQMYINLNASQLNNNSSALTASYSKADGFEVIPGGSDGTATGGATMGQSGWITWAIPDDWVKYTVNGITAYWVMMVVSADLDDVGYEMVHCRRENTLLYDLPALTAEEWQWAIFEMAPKQTPAPDETQVKSIGINIAVDKGVQVLDITEVALITENFDDLLGLACFQMPGDARITGLQSYSGNSEIPVKNPWIFTEEGVYELQTHNEDLIVEVPLEELETLSSGDNGIAHCQNGTYLYFNLGQKIERYFNRSLDDIGVDRDAGLPSGRRGTVTALESYAGRVFAAIDTGDGLSSVLALRGESWHEVYRTPIDSTGIATRTNDNQISGIRIQAIPGTSPDLLWISQGASELIRLPIDLSPGSNDDFEFRDEAHLVTSWIYANMYDVEKIFKTLKVHSENLTRDEQFIRVYYQIDEETTWTLIGDFYNSPSQEREINAISPTAKRLRYKVYLRTNDRTSSPRLKALVTEGVSFVPVKYQRSFVAGMSEGEMDIDLEGDDNTEMTVQEKYDVILDWANSGQELLFECNFTIHDNRKVFIHPPSISPVMKIPDEQIEKHVIQLTVIDV